MPSRIPSQELIGNPVIGITNGEIVAEDGTRVGQLGDVVLDNEGQIMGYEMAEVAIEGRVAVAKWIDVKATRSLGPDVLLVKSEYV